MSDRIRGKGSAEAAVAAALEVPPLSTLLERGEIDGSLSVRVDTTTTHHELTLADAMADDADGAEEATA